VIKKYMPKKERSIRSFEEFSENPFLVNLTIPLVPKANMYVKKDEAIINLSDGELKNDVLLAGKSRYVDAEHFVKIFVNEIQAIFDLSKSAQKVFGYMLSRVKYDDLLHFDIENCLKETGYKSKPPMFSAIGELLEKEFIAKTKNQFVYWINPKLFYKGDRLVVVKEYRKSKQDKIAAPNQLAMFNKQLEAIQKLEKRIEGAFHEREEIAR
jgi:hypothetical protein